MSIAFKDLIESLHNRTVLIVILLPVLASLLFSIVDNSAMNKAFRIGIIEEDGHFKSFIDSTTINLLGIEYKEEKEGQEALETGQIEALVIVEEPFTVYLDSSQSIVYFFLKDSLENTIGLYLNKKPQLDIQFIPVNISSTRLSFLPAWIMITTTMIGVLIVSGNLAEEKENKTLYSILMTPAGKLEVLLGKGLYGIILIFVTVMIMCFLNGVHLIGFNNIVKLAFSLLIASISFTTMGLLIGAFTSSQSVARSIGTIIYFPLLFPTLIADLSRITGLLARFLPTYYFYNILEKILVYQGDPLIRMELLFLGLFSLILFSITYARFRQAA